MWKIYNEVKNKNEAEILLYDKIAGFDNTQSGYISAKSIVQQIKALGDVKNITLRINSDGGELLEAFAIYNTLKASKATITVKIDGVAASSASIVAMAGDKILMPENSLMVLHNPYGYVSGDADTMRKHAQVLDSLKDMCMNIYSTRSGLSTEQLSDIMSNESYLTAEECKSLNLCDEIIDKIDVAAKMQEVFGPISSFSESEIERFKNEARLEERERLRALDGLRAPGRQEIIDRAKYDDPKSAKDIALELLKADNVQDRLAGRYQDSISMNGVRPSENDIGRQAINNMIDSITCELNRMRGYNNGR